MLLAAFKRLTQSLRGRLLISLFIFLLFFLGLTGYALDRAFQNSAETALQERLKTHIYALLAAAELSPTDASGADASTSEFTQPGTTAGQSQLTMPAVLSAPEFNRLNSGLYAFITDTYGDQLWRSASALSLDVKLPPSIAAGEHRFEIITSGSGERVFNYSYGVIWEDDSNGEHHYTFSVMQNDAMVMAEIRGFRATLWRWLGGICLLLVLAQWAIMHWGLTPLARLADDLKKIETGEQQQLTGRYPTELRNITTNLNLLINQERRQRARYRDTLADLAHSIKTPLSILRGLLNDPHDTAGSKTPSLETTSKTKEIDAKKIDTGGIEEQIERMDQIISYQLQRASTPATGLSVNAIEIRPLVGKIVRNLNKVYRDKDIVCDINIPENCRCYADERDMLEIMGNLLDNAFKYGKHRVVVSARREENAANADADQSILSLFIEIADDGPGIAPQQRQAVLARGVRADSRAAGQGIGLAVTMDIVTSYQGSLIISESSLGGALFQLQLA